MPSNSLVGSSPLSPNPNICNIPSSSSSNESPSLMMSKTISFKSTATVMMPPPPPMRSPHPNNFSPFSPKGRSPLKAFQYQGQHRTPPRAKSAAHQQSRTPQSQSSLPRWHYHAALPSPAVESNGVTNVETDVDDGDDDNDSSIVSASSGPIFGRQVLLAKALSSRATNLRRPGTARTNRRSARTRASSPTRSASNSSSSGGSSHQSDDDDKENANIQYSPALDNIKSKLALNRLRREHHGSQSDSLRSILSSVSRDGDDALATRDAISNARRVGWDGERREQKKKRIKIDLAPRIVVVANASANRMLEQNTTVVHSNNICGNHRTAVTTTTAVATSKGGSATIQKRRSTATNNKTTSSALPKTTQKFLYNALENMQQGKSSFDYNNNNNCSGRSSDAGSTSRCSNSSNASSLDDPFFERLNAKLDSFKTRRKCTARNKATTTTAGRRSDTGIGSSYTGYSNTGSNASSCWLSGSMAKQQSDIASSTFSVSPISNKEHASSSTVIGSYIGSLRLDGRGRVQQKDGQQQQPSSDNDISPAPTIDTQPTVGSYIGSVRLDSKGNEQPKEDTFHEVTQQQQQPLLKSSFTAVHKNVKGSGLPAVATTDSKVNVPPQMFNSTVTMMLSMVPQKDNNDDANSKGEEHRDKDNKNVSRSSFPPRSIDEQLCTIDRVSSELTTSNNDDHGCFDTNKPSRQHSSDSPCIENDGDTSILSPLPQSLHGTHQLLLHSGSSPILPCSQHRSPVPSMAGNSYAPSYATSSMATSTTDTSETTNLFDMLRNTFNHGSDGEDSSDEDGSREEGTEGGGGGAVIMTSPHQQPSHSNMTPISKSRPPLSPIPPTGLMQSGKQTRRAGTSCSNPRGKNKSFRHRRTSPKMSPKMSPKILRGTPGGTPCSNASSSTIVSILDNSINDENAPPATPRSEYNPLEYSFLAHALVATNILATPTTATTTPIKKKKKKSATTTPNHTQRSLLADGGVSSDDVPRDAAPSCSKGGAPLPVSAKRSHQDLNYASIGATSSSVFRTTTPKPRRVDPMAILALDAEMATTTPACSSNYGQSLPRKKQRTPIPADENSAIKRVVVLKEDDTSMPSSSGPTTVASSSTLSHNILSIALSLDDASLSCGSSQGSEASGKSSLMSSQEEQLSVLADRVKRLEEGQKILPISNNCSSSILDAYLNGDGVLAATSSSLTNASSEDIESKRTMLNAAPQQDHQETANLRERVKWLEKVLGFRRGANQVFQDEINVLKEKLSILERRLEEEMALKEEEAQKAAALTAEIEAAQDGRIRVEDSLRKKVQDLETELESEKMEQAKTKQEQSSLEERLQKQISDLALQLEAEKKNVAENNAVAEARHAIDVKAKDEEIKKLRQTNKGFLHKQNVTEKELVSCAKDNDTLRGRLLSMANEASTKEQTLSTALSQLKSLTENYYQVKQSLKYAQNARQDEVASLQWSLDKMSRQMLVLSKSVNELQNENDDLRNELKRQRVEKQRTMTFRRDARGC